MDNLERRASWFFDLDRTLYDTEAFYELVRTDLAAHGHTPEEVDDAKKAMDDYTFEGLLERMGYSPERIAELTEHFRRHFSDGNRLLLPNVLKTLQHLSESGECNLLTFGNERFQRAKYEGMTDLHSLIHEAFFISGNKTKGDVLQKLGERNVTLVDDAPNQLLDVYQKAPWVTRIRMMWPQFKLEAHPEDGKLWRVITSIEELL